MTQKADISFVQQEGKPYCDIEIVDNDILRDNTLLSAVYIMLLTDRRATLDEITLANLYPSFPYDLRGWWGDTYRESPIGSKLWLNRRRKATNLTLSQQIQYAKEALASLVDQGIAKRVTVNAQWVRKGVMEMDIQIVRTDDSIAQQTYTFLWSEVQNAIR